MRVKYGIDGYAFITDNSAEIDAKTLFLKTSQNEKYFDGKSAFITPLELLSKWQLDNMKIVGICGTNGKTTVAAAIYSLLLDVEEKPALQGTRGFFVLEERREDKIMTTPSIFETIVHMKEARDGGCAYFVMEVSSHAIEQERIEGLKFALKVHTNVTADHLDYHKTIEEYRRVKSLFFADETPKLLNKDLISTITYNPINAQSYGVDEPATFKVQAFSLINGITAGIKYFEEELTFHSPMVGLFNLYNLMAAIGAVHMVTGKPLEQICKAVEHFAGVGGRMEVVSRNPLVIVDFAHTDDGMLQVLQSMKEKSLSVVFGAGGNRDKLKRPRMGAVAGRYANHIYVTSDNPRDEEPQTIIDEIMVGLEGKVGVQIILDRKEAINKAIDELGEGDALLILGKGDEDYQEIAGVKHKFDDREVVREILKEKNSLR